MNAILTTGAATALWHDLVREAEERGQTTLDSETESYLVFLLMRHLRDAGLAGHVLALDYLAALEDSGHARRENLRDVGDRCLLIAGLFPEQAERRLVSLGYFLDMGSRAYGELADAARTAWAELFRRLAATFARLVRVLVEVRRLSSDREVLNAFGRHALCMADPAASSREFPDAIVLAAHPRLL
ncbi:hypothetical protein [Tahibacter amnicola]|uniref:Uncharacterized protein n=1 Tax=Tahibacter amnicola TaxID=2976241 RepID=A0ABY6BG06_9GAMM|nr:hypothetical protein [Tahibacter amnicola]UXI68717.1 hypothetical protein N4264_03430 [Tahibacter amnicola]